MNIRILIVNHRFSAWMLALAAGVAVLVGAELDHGYSSMRVMDLKAEHLRDPLGIDKQHPRFRWLMESTERDQLQTAYQILVASSLEKLQSDLGDKWDSGRVESANSIEVPYNGKTLASGERACWKVRIWDMKGRPSAYSEPTLFEMGLLQPGGQHRQQIRLPHFQRHHWNQCRDPHAAPAW